MTTRTVTADEIRALIIREKFSHGQSSLPREAITNWTHLGGDAADLHSYQDAKPADLHQWVDLAPGYEWATEGSDLPAGWSHEAQGPGADAWWHDDLPLGVASDARDTPRTYTVVHKDSGEAVRRSDGHPYAYPSLQQALDACTDQAVLSRAS